MPGQSLSVPYGNNSYHIKEEPVKILNLINSIVQDSSQQPADSGTASTAVNAQAIERAEKLLAAWKADAPQQSDRTASEPDLDPANPLRQYFDSISEGPGIWKWLHYFEPYHRHLSKFVGRPVTIVEVGVFSGGSMPMWREYFGDECHVHGIDIQPECRVYENGYTTIHIGDQADRQFWRQFRQTVPQVDVLIDDGGHTPEQQMVTLEEMLPHLSPGGVFICEDVHERGNEFTSFVSGLIDSLNDQNQSGDQQKLVSVSSPFQSSIHSISWYPYMVVIEKLATPRPELTAPKHGTQWQPFLK